MENALEVLLASLVLMAEDLKQKACEFRRILGMQGDGMFAVLAALEHRVGAVDGAFMYQIVEDSDWDEPDIGALYSPADRVCPHRVIYIKASLFVRAENGDKAALYCIAHELCHWFEDFRYGICIPPFITNAAARRVISHIIELYTNVFTCHIVPCCAVSEAGRAELASGSRELDSFMLEYTKFTDWRNRYAAGLFKTPRGTEKTAIENARHLSDKSRA